MSLAHNPDVRTIEPESDPASWPAWTDNWYWEPNTDLTAADRLGQAAESMERIAEVLDGLAPPELLELSEVLDGPFAREVLAEDRAAFDAAMAAYDAAHPIPDPLPETFGPVDAEPAPHLD
jgi:hypothetical protein